jgi:hypothetical protein
MQSIYTYIPETNHVPRQYNVAAVLLLLFMVYISLAPLLNLLHFYYHHHQIVFRELHKLTGHSSHVVTSHVPQALHYVRLDT